MIDATGTVPVDPLATLRSLEVAVVEVTKEESVFQEACNFLALGGRQAICYDLAPRLLPLLAGHEVRAIPVPGSELVKGTGGPRCMSRPVYGDGVGA
jgi:N-dimethylarginine dimethylaminohydrolase